MRTDGNVCLDKRGAVIWMDGNVLADKCVMFSKVFHIIVFLEILRLLQHFCIHIVMCDRGMVKFVKHLIFEYRSGCCARPQPA